MTELRVDNSEVMMDEDYCYFYKGQPFTGISNKFYEGKLLSETTFLDGSKNGLSHRWYFATDQLYYELNYKNNTLHGLQKYWYENGQLKSLELIEGGYTLKAILWDQQGEIVRVYRLMETDPLFKSWQLSRGSTAKDIIDMEISSEIMEMDEIINNHQYLLGSWS